MATWADVQKYFPRIESYQDGEGVGRYSINPEDEYKDIPGIGKVHFAVGDTNGQIAAYVQQGGQWTYLKEGPGGSVEGIPFQEDKGNQFTTTIGDVARDPKFWAVIGAGLAGNAGLLGDLGGTGAGFWEAGMSGGGAQESLASLSGSGVTDEMLLTGQAPAELGTLGQGTGVNAGWSGFSDVAGVTSALSGLSGSGTQAALSKVLSGEGSMQDLLGLLGPAMSIGSGLYGLDKAKDMRNLVEGDVSGALGQLQGLSINQPNLPAINLPTIDAGMVDRSAQAKAAIAGADPWGASGGRALADEQLQALMRSPGSLMTDPGYQARMMGTDRVMAAQGQLGGGGGAVAAANASGDYYQQRLAALAALENMGNPVGAQQVGLGQESLGLDQGRLNLQTQLGASDQTLKKGQLDLQGGQLNLDAQKALANLGATKAGLGMDAAKLKLAAAGGANTLAGQSLASIGYGVTSATGGDTMTSQAQAFLKALRAQGATV